MPETRMKKGGGGHTWIDLPGKEEIEASDSLREQAIESLLSELSASNSNPEFIKCQQCHVPVAIPPPSTHGLLRMGYNDRIITLRKRIKWAQERYPNADAIKELKQELATLVSQQAKRDIIRRLPLVSTKATGYKYCCSSCFDQAYRATYYKKP